MRGLLIISLLCLIPFGLTAQKRDTWISFVIQDTLVGFKDSRGKVKIEPRFSYIMTARKFDDIMVATEIVNGKEEFFYYAKSGRTFGKDSIYTFDAAPDCENEGFIRFSNSETGLTGLFDKNGNIVIPADYNDLSKVQNGLIVALKGAKKETDGEHYSWLGGETLLLDISNKILVRNFPTERHLNLYSLKKVAQPLADERRKSIKGTDGQYYLFEDFDVEFELWLKKLLKSDLNETVLREMTFEKVVPRSETEGLIMESKNTMLDKNFDLIRSRILELKRPGTNYEIFDESLNSLIYDSAEFEMFFNNCREAKDWLYPLMDVVITHDRNGQHSQDHLEFLRTDNGYKLVGITIR